MPQVRILQSAWEDLSSIADYHIREVGPLSAERITNEILNTFQLLATNPYLGPLQHDAVLQRRGFRKLLCGRYVCVYRVDEDVPTVYHIFHASSNYPSRTSHP